MSEVLDRQTIKALSADARQDIIKLLTKRPHTASEIAKIARKHVTTVGEHLETLERAGLVKKKDSTNKWVYYTLTEKGERLFKPQLYSWVVVFCLSIVFMFVGILRIFEPSGSIASEKMLSLPASDAAAGAIAPMASVDYLAYALIVLGLLGLGYLGYKKFTQKNNISF